MTEVHGMYSNMSSKVRQQNHGQEYLDAELK